MTDLSWAIYWIGVLPNIGTIIYSIAWGLIFLSPIRAYVNFMRNDFSNYSNVDPLPLKKWLLPTCVGVGVLFIAVLIPSTNTMTKILGVEILNTTIQHERVQSIGNDLLGIGENYIQQWKGE